VAVGVDHVFANSTLLHEKKKGPSGSRFCGSGARPAAGPGSTGCSTVSAQLVRHVFRQNPTLYFDVSASCWARFPLDLSLPAPASILAVLDLRDREFCPRQPFRLLPQFRPFGASGVRLPCDGVRPEPGPATRGSGPCEFHQQGIRAGVWAMIVLTLTAESSPSAVSEESPFPSGERAERPPARSRRAPGPLNDDRQRRFQVHRCGPRPELGTVIRT